MHRSLKITALSLAAVLGACDRLPQRHLITPELAGRLTKSGKPVAGASMLVVLRDETDTEGRACRTDLTSTRTDSSGSFLASAFHEWMRPESAEEMERSRQQFELCVRPNGSSDYRLLFRTAANRWDKMFLNCDLDRDWLAPDRQGSEGRCMVVQVGLEGQEVFQRTKVSPALTCDTTATLLERQRIGPVMVRASLDELRRLCRQIRDTMVVDWTLDASGQQLRSFVLHVANKPVVFRKFGGGTDKIEHIVVTSPVFRTRDGFGVGTPVAGLLEKPGLKLAFNGEPPRPHAYYFAWHGEECGVGYAIQPPDSFRGRPGGMIPTSEMRAWPPTMTVSRVYIGFCPHYFVNLYLQHGP